jgi:MbtH protein
MSSRYKVVINHEEQYSILPIDQTVTRGWQEVGVRGSGDECLRHIEEVWTDMRPAQREELQTVLRRG